MEKDKLIEVNELLHLLSLHGGEIVCTASLDANDINQARASGRLYVDENNTGFVWMPNIMRFPQTDEEVQFFEKWYPLDVEMPDNLVNPDNIINKARKEDELIEKLRKKKSEFECDQAPELSEGTMWLKYDELDLILTSLTAPVPDGKLPELELEQWPIDVDPEGNVEESEWMAGLKGTPIMVTAITKEKAIDELMTSIRVALLHDYNSKLTKTPDAG